jgi:hypothetical protein
MPEYLLAKGLILQVRHGCFDAVVGVTTYH